MIRTALVSLIAAAVCSAQPLAGTAPLEWTGDLDVRMMDGAHKFIERRIAGAREARQRFWPGDADAHRRTFMKRIGAVDPLVERVTMERFGDDTRPALVAESRLYRVYQVRWTVLDGVHAEGLLLEPVARPAAFVVAVPDADQTPEQIAGLAGGVAPARQFARRLAEHGCTVVIPTMVIRESRWSGNPAIKMTDQPHREWIYRQAFHMGRHIIGYEVQKVRAAVEWSRRRDGALPTAAAGYGEGGLIAFYAAASEPRIEAALVSGYFDSREQVWSEPIFRNVWGLLERFGDAEIAAMIAPRGLVVEAAAAPVFRSAKGENPAIDATRARREFERIGRLVPSGTEQQRVFAEDDGLPAFVRMLGIGPAPSQPALKAAAFDGADRQRRTVKELEDHVQKLVRASERTRSEYFLLKAAPYLKDGSWSTKLRHATHPPEPFVEAARPFREEFSNEVMGRFAEPYTDAAPKTRKIYDRENWTGYDVVLDVYQDLFAWGVLLVPKDLKAGERRPVVVCQHGRNGLPKDLIETKDSPYNFAAAKLADRGYIVFVPHNLYRGEDKYRWLSRKANSVQGSLFSFITAQHDQILRWLETLPFVDGKRIGFYGLSYGGETAMRVPAALEKYAVSVCSGDFNQWAVKVSATDEVYTYMFTIEWEMPYFNMGNTFDYAEMSYLIFPRPFMVERGHHDLVGRDRWVAYEYAKTRWLYTQLELPERTEIEYFNGGHAMNAEGTFRFLARHLNWPRGAL